MNSLERFVHNFFHSMGEFASSLDSTGWAILATCSLFAGYSLLKGPGIRGG